MLILAIETTDRAGSVAVLDGSARALASAALNAARRSASSLAPAIVDVLAAAGVKPSDVGLVAVAAGPGSFTGLRIGVTTAKMFAYAAGAKVLGVNTLGAVAWQAPAEARELWVVMDAQRKQVFCGRFSRDALGSWQWVGGTQLLDDQAWLRGLPQGSAVSGPGLVKLVDRLGPQVTVVDRSLWLPAAESVGRLAWRDYQAGRRDTIQTLAPEYFRRSAAEEKRAEPPASAGG